MSPMTHVSDRTSRTIGSPENTSAAACMTEITRSNGGGAEKVHAPPSHVDRRHRSAASARSSRIIDDALCVVDDAPAGGAASLPSGTGENGTCSRTAPLPPSGCAHSPRILHTAASASAAGVPPGGANPGNLLLDAAGGLCPTDDPGESSGSTWLPAAASPPAGCVSSGLSADESAPAPHRVLGGSAARGWRRACEQRWRRSFIVMIRSAPSFLLLLPRTQCTVGGWNFGRFGERDGSGPPSPRSSTSSIGFPPFCFLL
ncbi:hypothetical protein DIPPA_09657 [Diplonema papillatum]|nr:hypothetical protein DIPPA_09657 [Diplonema papillatum]